MLCPSDTRSNLLQKEQQSVHVHSLKGKEEKEKKVQLQTEQIQSSSLRNVSSLGKNGEDHYIFIGTSTIITATVSVLLTVESL